MQTIEFLDAAAIDLFKAKAIVSAIEERIKEGAKNYIFNKYKDRHIFRDGLEFQLIGVKVRFYTNDLNVGSTSVSLDLAYFCISKLPKDKRDKVQAVKSSYLNSGYLDWCNYKTLLWMNLSYEAKLNEVASGNLTLLIK